MDWASVCVDGRGGGQGDPEKLPQRYRRRRYEASAPKLFGKRLIKHEVWYGLGLNRIKR